MRRNWLLRGDGKARTIRPTQAALSLLIKVRDTLSQPGKYGIGMGTSDEDSHCVLGWMAVYSGYDANTYPNDIIATGTSLRHRYPVAAALLAETLNGDGVITWKGALKGFEDDDYEEPFDKVNETVVWSFSDAAYDDLDPRVMVVQALDRTIRYVEHELGVIA